MNIEFWQVLASLGVPGIALGIFYMLFKNFGWRVPLIPKSWAGPLAALFMVLTFLIVLFALVQFSSPNSTPNFENSTAISIPSGLTLKEIIRYLAEKNQAVVKFNPTCTTEILNTKAQGPIKLEAQDFSALVDALIVKMFPDQEIIIDLRFERGIYEVNCAS